MDSTLQIRSRRDVHIYDSCIHLFKRFNLLIKIHHSLRYNLRATLSSYFRYSYRYTYLQIYTYLKNQKNILHIMGVGTFIIIEKNPLIYKSNVRFSCFFSSSNNSSITRGILDKPRGNTIKLSKNLEDGPAHNSTMKK